MVLNQWRVQFEDKAELELGRSYYLFCAKSKEVLGGCRGKAHSPVIVGDVRSCGDGCEATVVWRQAEGPPLLYNETTEGRDS